VLRGDPPLPHVWHGHHVLRLIERAAWHDVWLFFDARHAFAGWYVNFQVPVERRHRRLVMCDLELDISVEPDRRWRWKDRDEYRELVERGLVTAAEADAVAADAERVVARIERGHAPFDDSLTGWRPDPAWARPPRWATPP
jgi:predicted RNA-binding protein associated with RNAse of E/G family